MCYESLYMTWVKHRVRFTNAFDTWWLSWVSVVLRNQRRPQNMNMVLGLSLIKSIVLSEWIISLHYILKAFDVKFCVGEKTYQGICKMVVFILLCNTIQHDENYRFWSVSITSKFIFSLQTSHLIVPVTLLKRLIG